MRLPQLHRVRWAVRATLTLGVAASVAANILHAQPNPISQIIAAWPPLALLLTVELISRIPVHRRSLAAVRLVATSTIAGIAAWVSYWHMVGVAAHYGETGPSPYLLPLSVDGLVIVASVSLVELAGRIRAIETAGAAAASGTAMVEPVIVGLAAVGGPAVEPVTPPVPDGATVVARPTSAGASVAASDVPAPSPTTAESPTKRSPAPRTSQSRAAKAAPAKAAPRKRAAATPADAALAPAELVRLAERMKAERPRLTQAAIAAELGVTTQRLQQAKRQAVAA